LMSQHSCVVDCTMQGILMSQHEDFMSQHSCVVDVATFMCC
jgi:hypothetical protein